MLKRKNSLALLLNSLCFLAGGLMVAGAAEPIWSWERSQAIVRESGDLEWRPEAFVFSPGRSLRYIDYDGGSDENDGSRDAPFKHHPWDAQAKGKAAACRGVHTYVFKNGVVYRGALKARESGTRQNPIRLTSDPSWGTGVASFAGSEAIGDWVKGATHPDIPEKDKVWFRDLDFNPRSVWMVKPGGQVVRIPLARTPNWKVSDPDDVKSEWFHWDNLGRMHFGHKDGKLHKAYDTKNINQPVDYYKGAVLWTEWGWVMGTPFPTYVRNIDVKEKWLSFKGQWGGGATGQIIRYNRYYLEDKPHYLDDPDGEFWFERKGKKGGRLFLRLPGGQDPNTAEIEAAKHFNLLEAESLSNVVISGLSFCFTNTFWDLPAGPWVHKDVDPACIRLLGSGENLSIKNCRFENVTLAVRVKPLKVDDRIDHLELTDNVIRNTDHGGVLLEDGGGWGKKDSKIGRLLDVKLLRNKFAYIGMRPNRFVQGHAMVVDSAETLEIAGNILDRCYGSGIHIFGAKRSALAADRPLSRILIHHNKVTDPMLNTNDWGGIETWQGGPIYVYNNISGNPGGYWHWKFKNHPNEPACARFGHAYYLDGAFKNYLFNNIAWGKSKDPLSRLGNTSAFQEIHSYQNSFFNNSVYNFIIGSRRQAPHAGRDKFIANIWSGIGHRVFRHSDPAKSMAEANAKDAGRQKAHFAYETNAYSRNVFHDVNKYGVLEANGRWLDSREEFQKALAKHQSLASDLGTESTDDPFVDPEKHDFRLKPDSAAIDRGTKFFVPWSLFAMVGEWNFYPAGNDPKRILDEHWYMTENYTDRQDYHKKPMFPLRAVGIGAGDYVSGPLEDWIKGALKFNGRNQYAVLDNAATNVKKEEKVAQAIPQAKYDWIRIDSPAFLTPGEPAEVKLALNGIPKGHFIQVDVHFGKKDGSWGGVNHSAGNQKVTGAESYTFKLKPVDKPDLGGFELVIFASADGSWKGRTKMARQKIAAKAAAGSSGKTLRSPQIGTRSFLLEAYFKTKGENEAVVVEKMAERGYSLTLNKEGCLSFKVAGEKQVEELLGKTRINDGGWHHVIAECDRKKRQLTLYVDGKKTSFSRGIGGRVDLTNDGNLYVAGTPAGRCLPGTFDFLRISQGTLEDAKTSIEELYAWQFAGPFLKDFVGQKPLGQGRDAGALERR